jgi:hypothetical protein
MEHLEYEYWQETRVRVMYVTVINGTQVGRG